MTMYSLHFCLHLVCEPFQRVADTVQCVCETWSPGKRSSPLGISTLAERICKLCYSNPPKTQWNFNLTPSENETGASRGSKSYRRLFVLKNFYIIYLIQTFLRKIRCQEVKILISSQIAPLRRIVDFLIRKNLFADCYFASDRKETTSLLSLRKDHFDDCFCMRTVAATFSRKAIDRISIMIEPDT